MIHTCTVYRMREILLLVNKAVQKVLQQSPRIVVAEMYFAHKGASLRFCRLQLPIFYFV